MSKYRKTIAAAGALLATLGGFLSDGALDASEGATLTVGLAGVIAVYAFPNAKPSA